MWPTTLYCIPVQTGVWLKKKLRTTINLKHPITHYKVGFWRREKIPKTVSLTSTRYLHVDVDIYDEYTIKDNAWW